MKYLIIGGTGSLGKAMLSKLYKDKKAEISIFSRNELNQTTLKEKFPKVNFILGDIRDFEALKDAVFTHDVVFHFAALKHVNILENNVSESIKSNILGTINVARACIENNVEHCIFSSTDKGVLPINVYGMCKAISEKYLLSLNKSQTITKFSLYRWGNVIASSGSAIPFFIKSLKERGEVDITDSRMSRFWINIERAVEFILETYDSFDESEIHIPKMKAASIERVAGMCAALLGIKEYKINYIGIRLGEKLHETILSDHDTNISSNNCEQYSDEELLTMLSPIFGVI